MRRGFDLACLRCALNAQFGFKPALVAYRGTNPRSTTWSAGRSTTWWNQSLNVIPQIKAAPTIGLYCHPAPARLESLPDVPTTKERGRLHPSAPGTRWWRPRARAGDQSTSSLPRSARRLDDPVTVSEYGNSGQHHAAGRRRGPAGLPELARPRWPRITPVLKEAAAASNVNCSGAIWTNASA